MLFVLFETPVEPQDQRGGRQLASVLKQLSSYRNSLVNYCILYQERLDRAAKKRALVDINAEDNQEGVMDSLLEALKTGTAFSRDQKRKRAARPAGGIKLYIYLFK